MPSHRTYYEIAVVSPTGDKTLLVYHPRKSRSALYRSVIDRAHLLDQLTGKPIEWGFEKKALEGMSTACGWKIQYTGRTELEAKSKTLGCRPLPSMANVIDAMITGTARPR